MTPSSNRNPGTDANVFNARFMNRLISSLATMPPLLDDGLLGRALGELQLVVK